MAVVLLYGSIGLTFWGRGWVAAASARDLQAGGLLAVCWSCSGNDDGGGEETATRCLLFELTSGWVAAASARDLQAGGLLAVSHAPAMMMMAVEKKRKPVACCLN